MNWRLGLYLCLLAFVVTLALVIGWRLSDQAMAVIIGVVAGVAASVPTSLVVGWLVLQSRSESPRVVSSTATPVPPQVIVVHATTPPMPRPSPPSSTVWPWGRANSQLWVKKSSNMTEPASPLSTYYKQGWEHYQHALAKTIAALSAEQLAILIAPEQRPIGDLLDHMIGARFNWFHLWMGEGDPNVDWSDNEYDEPVVHEAAPRVRMFEKSWHVIASALDRWAPADLQQVFAAPAAHQAWRLKKGLEAHPPQTRQWIVWHVMEHEIHHGGELALALGTQGVESFYNW